MSRRPVRAGPIDWADMRRRMERVANAVTGSTTLTPGQIRAVLEERARTLARPLVTTPPGDRLEVITFALAGERYAIEARYVIEVFRLGELSRLPGAASPVFGLTSWRGELLTILDVRPPLGLSAGALNDLGRAIVLGRARPAFGILADAVLEIVTLPVAEVTPPPDGAAARLLVRGITSQAVQVLDGEQVLSLL